MTPIVLDRIFCACGCGQEFDRLDQWGRNRRFISGHNGKKYDDPGQHKREWNHRNREARYSAKKSRFRRLKVKLIKERGGKCSSCSLAYDGSNAAVYHFHHRDRATKAFALGNQLCNKSWAKIKEEAEKCDMICANCHELRHSERF